MSEGFFGPCDQDGVYHDGGALSFSGDITVDNWWEAGPAASYTYTPSGLRRGLWQIFLEIVGPTNVTTRNNPALGVSLHPVAASQNNVLPQAPPLNVVWGWGDWTDGAPLISGYAKDGAEVDEGGGIFSQAWKGGKVHSQTCVLNKQSATPCCNLLNDCILDAATWDGLGYTSGTAREFPLLIQNDGFFTSPFPTDADWISLGMPHFTTIRFSGYWGDPPP